MTTGGIISLQRRLSEGEINLVFIFCIFFIFQKLFKSGYGLLGGLLARINRHLQPGGELHLISWSKFYDPFKVGACILLTSGHLVQLGENESIAGF